MVPLVEQSVKVILLVDGLHRQISMLSQQKKLVARAGKSQVVSKVGRTEKIKATDTSWQPDVCGQYAAGLVCKGIRGERGIPLD